MLDPITQIFLCKCQKGALLITVILCSVSVCWSSIKWLHVVFLCCVSAVFFPNIDAVQFSHTKDEYVLPVTNRVRYSVLISAAEPVVAAVCSQPGQVAPVTLHRPCGTKHFFPRRTAPPYEELCRPCHLNMAGGLVNVYNVTVFPLCGAPELRARAPETIHGLRTMMFPDQVSAAFLSHRFVQMAFIKWVYAFGKAKPRNKTVHNDR